MHCSTLGGWCAEDAHTAQVRRCVVRRGPAQWPASPLVPRLSTGMRGVPCRRLAAEHERVPQRAVDMNAAAVQLVLGGGHGRSVLTGGPCSLRDQRHSTYAMLSVAM
jgi:hypothetical protein